MNSKQPNSLRIQGYLQIAVGVLALFMKGDSVVKFLGLTLILMGLYSITGHNPFKFREAEPKEPAKKQPQRSIKLNNK